MKIVIATGIYPPESGGPATYSQSLALALKSRGHEVLVVTYGEGVTKVPSAECRVQRISRRGGSLIRYIRYAWRVFLLARHMDIVYLQGSISEGFPGTIGAWLAGKQTVMRVPGDYAWESYQQNTSNFQLPTSNFKMELLDEFIMHRHKGSIRILEAIERWTARRARHVIVPSKYLKGIVQAWGVPEDRITVIYSTVQPLPTVAPRDELRCSFGVTDSIVILTAVRVVPWKGVDVLIDVLRDLPENFRLVVAGDGPVLAEWKQIAADQHLESRVIFLGRIDRKTLAEWYEAADAFVLNSGYEGYPHVVSEAASRGLPCFVSDKGGNPETKETFGDLITILPYNDKTAWTSTLSKIIKPTSNFQLPTSFSFNQMVDRVIEILHKARKVS